MNKFRWNPYLWYIPLLPMAFWKRSIQHMPTKALIWQMMYGIILLAGCAILVVFRLRSLTR